MKKICLALICFWITSNALAQSNNSGPQDITNYGPAINVAVSNTDETEADIFFADAERNERRGDLNEALTLFGKAAFEYNSDKKLTKYATSLLRMSNVHLLLSHYTEAEQVILNAAIKTYSKIGSRTGLMASYNQLGRIYLAGNKLTQSLWFYTQQGILAQQLKNNTSYIESVLGMASVKIKKKEYALAIKDLNKADLLAKNAKITQFTQQIKASRSIIADKQSSKNKVH
jgi:tetratricopeptide (TPR) repeat protein